MSTVWKPKSSTATGTTTIWQKKDEVTQQSTVVIGSEGSQTSLVTGLINQLNVSAHLIDNEYMHFGKDKDFSIGFDSINNRLSINLPNATNEAFHITNGGAFQFPNSDLSTSTALEGGVYYYDNNLYLGIGE
jgi:hypothetical protein